MRGEMRYQWGLRINQSSWSPAPEKEASSLKSHKNSGNCRRKPITGSRPPAAETTCTQPPSFASHLTVPPISACPALTSQSIQLSHPTVLVLLGNDLKDRGQETAVEERQMTTREQQGTEAGHRTLPPQVKRATAACLCVHDEELPSPLLPMP